MANYFISVLVPLLHQQGVGYHLLRSMFGSRMLSIAQSFGVESIRLRRTLFTLTHVGAGAVLRKTVALLESQIATIELWQQVRADLEEAGLRSLIHSLHSKGSL